MDIMRNWEFHTSLVGMCVCVCVRGRKTVCKTLSNNHTILNICFQLCGLFAVVVTETPEDRYRCKLVLPPPPHQWLYSTVKG